MAAVRRIGVLCSGGDAPGMNACIRAIVRTAVPQGIEVIGILRGYSGLLAGEFRPLGMGDVSGIIQQGGTILYTSRCEEFKTPQGRARAYEILRESGIEGLIVIGGDGSFHGARLLGKEWNYPVIGVPGTIDNDLAGTDYTIGYDTAVDTAVEAMDRIRDTAESHWRIFVLEVMGRQAGFIALGAALAGGAEAVLVPEFPFDLEDICQRILQGEQRGKRSFIIVTAEGAMPATQVARFIEETIQRETRVTVLGHLQRGGRPTVDDRILATRCGVGAVEALARGETLKMVGVIADRLVLTEIDAAWKYEKKMERELYDMVYQLGL